MNYDDELDKIYDKWLSAKSRAERLEKGPGGIMEMKQTIADKEKRIEYLEDKMREIIAVPLWDEYLCIEIAREALKRK